MGISTRVTNKYSLTSKLNITKTALKALSFCVAALFVVVQKKKKTLVISWELLSGFGFVTAENSHSIKHKFNKIGNIHLPSEYFFSWILLSWTIFPPFYDSDSHSKHVRRPLSEFHFTSPGFTCHLFLFSFLNMSQNVIYHGDKYFTLSFVHRYIVCTRHESQSTSRISKPPRRRTVQIKRPTRSGISSKNKRKKKVAKCRRRYKLNGKLGKYLHVKLGLT